ncbi:MAG: hypothetical protein FWF31_10810 [Desulfobulbus sp.]|nr:hypothetical protein [Desulfobulbus sp.]
MTKTYHFLLVLALLPTLAGCPGFIRGNPLWQAPIVSQTECRSIDGRYLSKGKLFGNFSSSAGTRPEEKYWSKKSINEIPVIRSISLDKLKETLPPDEIKKMTDSELRALPGKYLNEQQRKFDSVAITEITKTQDGWDVALFGGDGTLYVINSISGKHPNAGCDANGRLVLRGFYVTGSPGTPISGHAYETVFEKKNDGSLEMRKFYRVWLRTMAEPPRRESEESFNFPPVQ